MSLVKLLSVLACATLAMSVAASAQREEITIDSKPTPDQIDAWLGSGDPRLIAWGAHFARETGDVAATPAMVRLLEEWKPGQSGSEPAAWSRLSISYVLDTLISRGGQATPAAILAIDPSFRTEAIILASKLPVADAKPILLDWYKEREAHKNSVYPRIAAMLLSRNPSPGFAASVLKELNVKLEIDVTVPDHGYGYGGGVGGSTCGDGGGWASRPGWPPLFLHAIEENSSRAEAETLVFAGGDRITYSRVSGGVGWGSCFAPLPLTSDTRFHLVAEMVGVAPEEMPWQPRQSANLVWKSDEQYLRDLGDIIRRQESGFHSASQALLAKGYLSEEEAEAARPQLDVAVSDRRGATYSPLPHLELNDAHTSLSYSKIGQILSSVPEQR